MREGRIGLPIAQWAREAAQADGRFEVDFVDLAELNLPMMDEPQPSPHEAIHQGAHDCVERAGQAADAFLFAFPEYNHSYAPAIKNALDYLNSEWNRKPVGFINWGGNSRRHPRPR